MKKKFVIVIVVLLLCTGLLGGTIYKSIKKPFKTSGEYTINIEKGDNFYRILNKLYQEKIVSSPNIIKFYVKFNKINVYTRPGKYKVTKDMSLRKFITLLNKGNKDNLIKIVVPEGYNLDQIGKLLEDKGVINKDDFLKSCKEYNLPNYIKKVSNAKYALEGYLFPDTYEFQRKTSGDKIISDMLKRFNEVLLSINNGKHIDDKELHNIVTIASIVEKEAKVEGERRKVASVFYNRLNKKMKLQSCSTVLYALGYHKEKLYNKDLNVKSDYNTYLVNGLPPGPICSPGKYSLIATVNPVKTDYLYFVSTNDGKHFFTKDYNDFLKVKKTTQGF